MNKKFPMIQLIFQHLTEAIAVLLVFGVGLLAPIHGAADSGPDIKKALISQKTNPEVVKVLAKLHGNTYNLDEGPFALCPERLGIFTNANVDTVRVYPMKQHETYVKAQTTPLMEIQGLHSRWEKPKAEFTQKGHIEQKHSALVGSKKIRSTVKTRAQIDENINEIATNAELQFTPEGVRLIRWSTGHGLQMSNRVQCSYQHAGKNRAMLHTARR